MKMYKRIISLIISVSILFSTIFSSNAIWKTSLDVYADSDQSVYIINDNNEKVDSIMLSQNTKKSIKVITDIDSSNISYQWQIYIADDNNWVNIENEINDTCIIQYTMIANQIVDDIAQIRCNVIIDDISYYSNVVKVSIETTNDNSENQNNQLNETIEENLKDSSIEQEDSSSSTQTSIEETTTEFTTEIGTDFKEEITTEESTIQNEESITEANPTVSDDTTAENSIMQNEESTTENSTTANEEFTTEVNEDIIVNNTIKSSAVNTISEIDESNNDESNDNGDATIISDEVIERYQVVVNYYYSDDDDTYTDDNYVAYDPFVAELAVGTSFEQKVSSPTLMGYTPIIYDESGNKSAAQRINIVTDSSKVYNVFYEPILVEYSIRHYFQNITDDMYTEDLAYYTVNEGYTGDYPDDSELNLTINGFTSLITSIEPIAADNSTVFHCYYDRNYYLIKFDLNGGYGVEPIYGKYGTSFILNKPTKHGWVFKGWDLVSYVDEIGNTITVEDGVADTIINSISAGDRLYKALWETTDTEFTVVYWKENADDDNYSYCGSKVITNCQSSDIVNGADYKDVSFSDIDYFTFNANKTDKNVIIEGDGSTVVNVYYDRNIYTMYFKTKDKCRIEEHTHVEDCYKYLCDCTGSHTDSCSKKIICGKLSHTHTTSCNKSRNSNYVKIISAKYDSDISSHWSVVSDDGNADYAKYWWKSNLTGDYYTFLEKVPNSDITLTGSQPSGVDHSWSYYLETLDSVDYSDKDLITDNGITYYRYHTTLLNCSTNVTLTYDEDYFPITGFTQRDSEVPKFDSNYTANLFYLRQQYSLEFYNMGTIIPNKTEYLYYESDLKDLYFEPEYPETLEVNAYAFNGWYTTAECYAGSEFDFNSTMPATDLILYASWVPVTHKVTFYNTFTDLENNNDYLEQSLVLHGNTITTVPSPSYEDYVFKGWFYLKDGVKTAYTPLDMPITKDLNVFADWTSDQVVKFKVSYRAVEVDEDYNITNVLDENIADPYTGKSFKGATRTFTAKAGNPYNQLYDKTATNGTNYNDRWFPLVNSHSILMSENDGGTNVTDYGENIYTFNYIFLEHIPYTVRYVDKTTGKDLLDPVYYEDNTKAIVTEKFVPITGYVSDAFYKRLVLSANLQSNEIIFYYTLDDDHAYYAIHHMTQNVDGETYSEYSVIEGVSDIGSNISVNILDISGFEFTDESIVKFEENGIITENVVKADAYNQIVGEVTQAGTEIYIYYNRLPYSYKIRYLEYGTNVPMQTDASGNEVYDTGTALFGETIVKVAKDFENYQVYGDSVKSKSIKTNEEQNVITFYYNEEQISILYKAVCTIDSESFGAVSLNYEIVNISENLSGCTPITYSGFRFVGWYTDADCTIEVDQNLVDSDTNRLTPNKEDDDSIFYALFAPDVASLKIKKSGALESDNQTFLFKIEGQDTTNSSINTTVVIEGNDSIIINDLPVGNYRVSELTDWSWRYEVDGDSSVIKNVEYGSENLITFNNDRINHNWITDNDIISNNFNE